MAPAPQADPTRQRKAVDAYLPATRSGDFEALLTLLDPDVVLHAGCEGIEDDGDEDASSSDAWLAVADRRIDGDALQELVGRQSLILRCATEAAQSYACRSARALSTSVPWGQPIAPGPPPIRTRPSEA